MLSDLRFRLRAIFDRRALEQELEDELRAHVERETEKYVAQGIAPAEAARRARLAFGGMERIKEDARDARGVAALEALLQDLRYAARGLRSRPGFTAAVVLALGLGIGANAAMFGIVDRLLFRSPAGLADADRVHQVFIRYLWGGVMRTEGALAYTRFGELKESSSFDATAAVAQRDLAVGTGADAREVPVATVSATTFTFFDVQPVIGRFFTPEEDRTPSGTPVVVLGHGFWQANYGGRTDVLGTSLHVGTTICTVIGVAPEGFTGFSEQEVPAIFMPITAFAHAREPGYYQNYNWSWLSMYVRRKPGVSLEAATAELTTVFHRSWEAERTLAGRPTWPTAVAAQAAAVVAPYQTARGPDAGADSKVASWVMGVSLIVLLVACANVANLLLARAVGRRREIALRLALGVTRRRLLQQLLTESLLLAALGGVAGLMLAQWGGGAFRALYLGGSASQPVATDARTLAFVAIVSFVVALATGLAPAISTLREDVSVALRAGAREGTYRGSRARAALLLFQGALSVLLLVGAGLFVRSLQNVRNMRLGYDAESVVYVEGNARGVEMTTASATALMERLVSAATTVPGVASASPTLSVPFYGSESRGTPFVVGGDTARIRRLGPYSLQAGSSRYFDAIGTRIVRGRGISPDDRATTVPVVVVSEAMAAALWPGVDALGKQLRISEDTMPFLTVVGIAEDTHARWMSRTPENWYYLPMEQYLARYGGPSPSMFVRVNGAAESFVTPLRQRLQQEMPGASYVNTMTLQSLVAPTQRSWEFGATMFVAFGGLALILAAIGLYSMITYSVAQRRHEFGVRMALGASARNVLQSIIGHGVAFASAGILIGGVVALWAGRWLEPLLFAQSARDPFVFLTVALVLLAVAVVATLQPALRATRVDPTRALRGD